MPAGAPSGSSSTGSEARLNRPSEMKDEGRIFSLPSFWLVCAVYPECLSTAETVRRLLSGSLTHTHVRNRLPQMLRRTSRSFLHIFHILLPTQDECQSLLLCSLHYVALLLCLRRLILPTALHLGRLCPFLIPVPHHVLTVRCLSAAYPGILQMVLYLCSSYLPFLR